MPHFPTLQQQEAWHAFSAARVLHWPFEALSKYIWSDLEHPIQSQLLERQLRFIANLHSTEAVTLELRYLCHKDDAHIDCVLLGKATAADEDGARAAVAALQQKASALLPVGYSLSPVETENEMRRAFGVDFLQATDQPAQWAEIRRRAEFLLWTDEALPARHLPVVHPFGWQPAGWEAVWVAMARAAEASVVSVSLRPASLSEAEEIVLAELIRELRDLAAQAEPALTLAAERAADDYQHALPGLRAPFAVRVAVVGPPAVQNAVRGALSGNTAEPQRTFIPAECLSPSANELPTLRHNLLSLEQADWGTPPGHAPNLVPPLNRLRYLCDTAQALCAFRLPLLPPDGLPGLRVGDEFAPQ